MNSFDMHPCGLCVHTLQHGKGSSVNTTFIMTLGISRTAFDVEHNYVTITEMVGSIVFQGSIDTKWSL